MKTIIKPVSNSANKKQLQMSWIWPIEADVLCLFSTVEGYPSWQYSIDGSIFVSNLCNQIKENGKQLEFHHLLIRVNAAVGRIQI